MPGNRRSSLRSSDAEVEEGGDVAEAGDIAEAIGAEEAGEFAAGGVAQAGGGGGLVGDIGDGAGVGRGFMAALAVPGVIDGATAGAVFPSDTAGRS
jgi:hypothetical protein